MRINHSFPSDTPRQGWCVLSQAQEGPGVPEPGVFASVCSPLPGSFPNDTSKPLGQQLVAWFGRVPFEFAVFYVFFSFSRIIFTD